MADSSLFSVGDAAKFLGVSIQTLRRWDASGKLESRRNPGNDYRYYTLSDLEPFKAALKASPEDDASIRQFFQATEAEIDSNSKLREPQREAHRHARNHFAKSSEPAILQIPVGCGKTGIMATLPFGISKGRVLIITPNLTILNGVAAAIDITNPKCFWRLRNILKVYTKGPYRSLLNGKNANIHDCYKSHFVITNIQQLASSADRWLPQFPDQFFDLILVDEGHHNVAESWRKVFLRFPEAKVISLTATPFRTDGEPLVGTPIYRYSYAKAMVNGYIKRLHAINVAPQRLAFTFRNDKRHHTLEEVLSLREEAWFRRGIALAPECNRHIVEASIRRCLMLREKNGFPHQVIAVACSVDHARQVRALYQERGFRTEEIHTNLAPEERDRVLAALRNNTIDCIVQVQMLGEGFDHPQLSVAAVFRPYRSLSAYIQFIGRIMRVNFENDPEHIDNEGFVISHVGLNNDSRWNDFRDIELADQKMFRELLSSMNSDPDSENSESDRGGHSRRFDVGMQGVEELVSHFITQSFLDPKDDRVVDTILNQPIPGTGLRIGDLVTREKLREQIAERQKSVGEQVPEEIPVQPQDERVALRKRVADRSKSVANRVLSELGLSRVGRELGRVFPQARRLSNFHGMIRVMAGEVNNYLDIADHQRGEVPLEKLKGAYDNLDAIGDEVVRKYRAAQQMNKR